MSKRTPGVGSFRTAHGQSAKTGQTMVFETLADGMRPAPVGAAAPIERRENGSFTAAGAAAAARRRHELAKQPDFARQELEFVPVAGFVPFEDGRRGLLAAKTAEIVTVTGCADSGVMTTLRGYSWLIAFAEYWAVMAATTGDGDAADKARRFFKDASIELAKAWEFARVSATSRPKPTDAYPWLAAPKPEAPSRPVVSDGSAAGESDVVSPGAGTDQEPTP